MRGRKKLASVLAGLLVAMPVAWAETTDNPWIKLGEKRIGTGLETGTLEIDRSVGAIARVRFSTTGADLFVQELRLYFTDGEMQRVVRDAHLARDAQSDAFPVEGGSRPVERIEMTFKGRATLGRREGAVTVWAEPERPTQTLAALADGWLSLGQQTVGASIDRATYRVGREAGLFESIRLAVQRNDVAFHDIRVIYIDGEVDTLAVRRLIKAGDTSPPLALKGEARFIREVELVQESNPEIRERAVVEVLARRSPAIR